ncbi:ABC transporter permease [Stackebrandtia nassauensis]|uniref:ABC transporter permease n=1 Tax=Stackebrandtia nassauensis (strain DSM 44728 / CIP 108903 / NRRL B-16338 / NBRC 102104 / LLR-40K-21) TaxID=446470 RepID=D3Q818_STANL|nr:ABC transporter permease [Stackebrandtia nassauensis]ADD40523.1 hypothetical protein Snas_0811 [Stackebrandtia nassauensis DSM 44728]
MWASTKAELHKMVRRGANWFMLAIALVLGLTFAYLVPYAGYVGGDSDIPSADRGLEALLPAEFVGNSIGGLPFFTGAISLILGALAIGNEYGWGTWKTVLTQGPSRLTVFSGKLAALTVANLVLVASGIATSAAASAIIASVEDQAMDWPAFADVALGLGGGWLIAMMWTMMGVTLAVTTRGVAVAVGIGLVWMLAVQNLLVSIAAPLIDWIADAQEWLPGPVAGSLVESLGANPNTPGVAELVSDGHALTVICGYLLLFGVLSGVLLRRRDVV